MNVGKSIKHMLISKGMSQAKLAEQLGVSKVWVNRLANSRLASMATIETLAAFFEMKVSEFVALGED